MLRNLLQQADIDHVNYLSHSFRIGATTTAAAAAAAVVLLVKH